jgi:hypothetical protein
VIPSLVLPALAALAVGLPAAGGHGRLHPRVGARALALATVALALAVAAAVASVAVGFVTALPWIEKYLPWCRGVGTHHAVPLWLGLPALGLLGAMVVSALRAYRQARHDLWAPRDEGAGLRVVDDDRPEAYAVGGGAAHVVVSTGMLALLDPAERRVLLAHERSHLRHRHHRYLALARVTTSAVPVLGFLTRRLRLAIERWADEDAVQDTGGDRGLVARTIILAALARTDYEGGAILALGSVGVRARVEALLRPAPAGALGPVAVLVPAVGAVVLVLMGSAVQLHHLLAFAFHVCDV